MPTTYIFYFVDEANSHKSNSCFPCFFRQVEHFELPEHFVNVKYPEHAGNLSDDLNQWYLVLLALPCVEHRSQMLPPKTIHHNGYTRRHFYFRLATGWIENLCRSSLRVKWVVFLLSNPDNSSLSR